MPPTLFAFGGLAPAAPSRPIVCLVFALGLIFNSVTPTDVRWACQLLSRLSERQWRAAFRAAQYDEQHATRYISKIKQKIAQGLALTAPPAS